MRCRWASHSRTTWFLAVWLLTGLGLCILTFVLLWNKEVHNQDADLHSRCVNGAVVLEDELFNQIFSAGMYNGLIHAFPTLSTAQFETFANFTNYVVVNCDGISYFKYVPGAQRAAAEEQLGANFTQSVAHSSSGIAVPPFFVPRGNASEYVISWRMSSPSYDIFTGWDLLSDPNGGLLVNMARSSGCPIISSPFYPPLGGEIALSVLWPFYSRNPFQYVSAKARIADFQGLILATFNIGQMFDGVASKYQTTFERLTIYDTTNATDPLHGGVLFYNRSKGGDRDSGRRFTAIVSSNLGNRSYRLECRQWVGVGSLLAAALPWTCLVFVAFKVVAFSVYFVTRRFQRDKEEVRRVEKLNTDLDLARQTAESADKAKSSFLAMMSHELRTPMTGTLGMLDLLRLTPMSEEQSLYVTTMQSSAESLLACLNDILDFSKIEAGQLRLEEIDFDIRDVVQQVTGLFSAKVQERGLQIFTELPEPQDCKARGDPLRLQQVLTNLLSNAIKFTEKGNITICWRRLQQLGETNPFMSPSDGGRRMSGSSYKVDVALDIEQLAERQQEEDEFRSLFSSCLRRRRSQAVENAESSDDDRNSPAGSQVPSRTASQSGESDRLWYEVSVSDTGLGMTEEVQRKLFRSFVQANSSTTRMFGGTGLGLVICKKLVTAMGGSINVQSEVDEGSTFTCTVPLRPQRPVSSLQQEPKIDTSAPAGRLIEMSNLVNPPPMASNLDSTSSDLESATDMQQPDGDGATVSQAALQSVVDSGHAKNCSEPPLGIGTSLEEEGYSEASAVKSGAASHELEIVADTSLGASKQEKGPPERLKGGAVVQRDFATSQECPPTSGKNGQVNGPSFETGKDQQAATRILVAEDNLVNQMLIKNMLTRFGHNVDIVGNGALAVEAVKSNRYNLCLMDLQMPVMDGIMATEQIRRLPAPKCDLPIYILSADVLAQDKLTEELKINGYLTKPIKWDILLATIDESLKAKAQ